MGSQAAAIGPGIVRKGRQVCRVTKMETSQMGSHSKSIIETDRIPGQYEVSFWCILKERKENHTGNWGKLAFFLSVEILLYVWLVALICIECRQGRLAVMDS